jgi:hypothetical protein
MPRKLAIRESHPPYDEDYKWKVANVARHRTKSESIRDIAREYNVSPTSVVAWMKKYGGGMDNNQHAELVSGALSFTDDDQCEGRYVTGATDPEHYPRCYLKAGHKGHHAYPAIEDGHDKYHPTTRQPGRKPGLVEVIDASQSTLVASVAELVRENQRLATELYNTKEAHTAEYTRLILIAERQKKSIDELQKAFSTSQAEVGRLNDEVNRLLLIIQTAASEATKDL